MTTLDPHTGYLRDILYQPQALEATRLYLEQGFNLGTIPPDLRSGKIRQVILTGMGSSLQALYPLYYHLVQNGVPVTHIEAAELIQYAPALLNPGSLMVAVSQSGLSAEIVHLLDMAAQNRVRVLGLTNTPGSPLAERADQVILTQAGEEFTVSCKTYVTALLALRWLQAGLLGQDLSEARMESRQAVAAVQAYLEHWQEYVAALMPELKGMQHFFLTGRGPSLATVYTSSLTTKEASHVQGEGMSCATLRHGPMEMIGPGCYVMVFAGHPQTSQLNLNLAKQLQAAGATVGWVDTCAEPGVYHLPPAPETLRPMLEILPVQMMTLALAELQGRVAGHFERSAKVTVIE